MAIKDRYKLVYHYDDGSEKLFELDYADGTHRKAFTLTEIDTFTTNFSNEKELEEKLNLIFPGYNNGHFSIEYRSNGSIKSLELVFSDINFIKEVARKNLKASNVSRNDINIYMRWILNKLEKDDEFLNYIYKHGYVNEYFRSALSNYLMLKQSDEKEAQSSLWQAEVKLRKEFMKYKTIRGLEVGRKNYELKKQDMYISKVNKRLTVMERAKLEYELNHPKKKKKSDPMDRQLPLFDPDIYTENNGKRTRR